MDKNMHKIKWVEPEEGTITKVCYMCLGQGDVVWEPYKAAYECRDIKACYLKLCERFQLDRHV